MLGYLLVERLDEKKIKIIINFSKNHLSALHFIVFFISENRATQGFLIGTDERTGNSEAGLARFSVGMGKGPPRD